MIRFLRWCLGLNPIDLLYDKLREAQEERNRARQLLDEANHLAAHRQKALSEARDEAVKLRAEASRLRQLMVFEQNARGLYEQVVIEASQQIDRNKGTSPATVLGVLRTVFVEAVGTVEAWRQGAPAEPGMVVNLRATMANRLLADPVQRGKLLTERNRTGKAGDSTSRPSPQIAHVFEWSSFNFNSQDPICSLSGCGQRLSNPIHKPTVGWSPPATEDPEKLVKAVEGKLGGLSPESVKEVAEYGMPSGFHNYVSETPDTDRICTVPGCGKPYSDPVHHPPRTETVKLGDSV